MPNASHADELPPSGDVMDLLNDEVWLREAIRTEEESGGDISAGPNYGANLGRFLENPTGYQQFLRLKRLVLRGFRVILREGNLGVGEEVAWLCGKPLVITRLENPPLEVQEQLLGLLADSAVETEPMPTSSVQAIRKALLAEDWEAIASAASTTVHQRAMQVAA
jgi:hypothetical protein